MSYWYFLLCISLFVYLSPYSILITTDSPRLSQFGLSGSHVKKSQIFFPPSSNLILLFCYLFCVFDVFYWYLCLSSLLSPSMSSLFLRSHTVLDATISQNTTDAWLYVTDFIQIWGGCNEVIISEYTTENNLYHMVEIHPPKHQTLPWDFPLLYSNLSVKGFI